MAVPRAITDIERKVYVGTFWTQAVATYKIRQICKNSELTTR